MDKPLPSNDEARLAIVDHFARAIWCFFMEEGQELEENAEDLEVSQGMAFVITESMKLEVLKVDEEGVFTVKIDVSNDPIPFIFGLEEVE